MNLFTITYKIPGANVMQISEIVHFFLNLTQIIVNY